MLQTWDVNASQATYPGGSCGPSCTPPSITGQPANRTITAGQSTTLSVTASGTAPLTYQWYIGATISGQLMVHNQNNAGATTHVVVDVNGYFR